MTQYHDKAWKQFAAEWHLNLKRVSGISSVEYEYAATRTAKAAWDRRSEIEAGAEGAKAYYNAGIQHASEVAHRLHGAETARAIQELRQ